MINREERRKKLVRQSEEYLLGLDLDYRDAIEVLVDRTIREAQAIERAHYFKLCRAAAAEVRSAAARGDNPASQTARTMAAILKWRASKVIEGI